MIIERQLSAYVVPESEAIDHTLRKIGANKAGFALVVSTAGQLVGVVTDGDVRRWLVAASDLDLSQPVTQVASASFVTAKADAPRADIAALFNDRIRFVPLVDGLGRLVALALPRSNEVHFGDRVIGPGHPSFVIAEIGNNHNGDVDLALRLVDLAKEAGADCAKFQMRNLSKLYGAKTKADDANQDLGAQYTLDLLSRFNLGVDALTRCFDRCRELGMLPLCTPWDLDSVEALERCNIAGYKVASADLTNHELLHALAETGKPLIMSTGMSTETEIREAVDLLSKAGAQFVLLHCNSTYPAPFRDVNLRYMDRLAQFSGVPVGYSGHERGYAVAVAAVARGATVIEKHFTVDRSMEGNDHRVSLLPGEFAEMVTAIRQVEESMGFDGERRLSQGEMMNREVLAKSLVAARAIQPGEVIHDDMVIVRGPGQGLQPNRRSELVGRVAGRAIAEGECFFPSDIESRDTGPRPYRFRRKWGVPVRWHDYKAMLAASNVDLLEYHLSYKDMDAKLEDWFDKPLDIEFVVHAPELFAHDHVLDLVSDDEAYRAHSIKELQRVIDLTRALKRWHPRTKRPCIVVNMGGFTEDAAMPVDQRAALYDRLAESLKEIDAEGVELIPQTMPPFPWHFGGQRFHNLFIDPDEILGFCKAQQMRICLDVSHSQLACNHYKWSMTEFVERVGAVSAHLHLADSAGVDGEGLQIGEGNIDFGAIATALDRVGSPATFIPEIWQGHKNGGEGFWIALQRLEPWFGGGRPPELAVVNDRR